MWPSIVLLLILFVIGLPVAVIVLFTQMGQLRRDIAALKKQIHSAPPAPPAAEPVVASPDILAPATEEPAPQPSAPPAPAKVPSPPPQPTTARPPIVARPAQKGQFTNWIESLKAANWLILAGGVVLAFGVVFLIEYSIEEGLLGPLARVVLGALLGFIFLVLGELARHRSLGRLAAVLQQDALPATLTGAGVLALFTSCYGAYALYELLPPMAAFVLLAMIAFGALTLSFWHGPIIASLGVAGAFAIPALVSNTDSTAITLFSYLAVVAVTALLIARQKEWFWLGLVALIGAGLWQLMSLGMLIFNSEGRESALGFAMLMALAFGGLLKPFTHDKAKRFQKFVRLDLIGAGGFAFFAFAIFQDQVPRVFEITAVIVVAVGLSTLAYRLPQKFPLFVISGLFTLVVLAGWPFEGLGYALHVGEFDRQLGLAPMVPRPLMPLLIASTLSFVYFVILGLFKRTGRWAITATAISLLILVNAYARINGFETSLSWGALGLVASIVFLVGANRLKGNAADVAHDPALAAYAVGVLGALALAATMTLERAWLSVALALLIPASAWVSLRIQVSLLRRVAFVLALIVFVRLLLNPFALEYPIDPPLWINWMQYGYGLPAIAFFFAARWFRQSKQDLVTDVLQVGVLVFVLVLALSQVRLFIHDGVLNSGRYLLSEAAVNTLTWLAFAYGLGRSRLLESSPVLLQATRLLYLLAAGHLVWVHILMLNPLSTNEPVGQIMFIDVLSLAYLAPLGFAYLIAAGPGREEIQRHLGMRNLHALSLASYVMGLIYVSLEVRHFFHGTRLNDGPETDLELYTYSLVWVLYAAALMGVGIWKDMRPLRMAGLATIALVTLKIFLLDMDELEGLLRVFSFFGLAASLFGIGYLYQRFVVVAPKTKGGDTAPPSEGS